MCSERSGDVARSLHNLVSGHQLRQLSTRGELMRQMIVGCLCALILVADAGAQNGNVTTDTKVTSDNGKVVTMIGCVMIGGGTNFTLANIISETPKDDRTARAGGPYALVEREGLDLGPYIGQRVEVKAVAVPPAAKGDRDDKISIKETTKSDVENGADRKSNATTTVKVARGAMPQFLVASVKMLSPHCDR
jgi:hypothetical protein